MGAWPVYAFGQTKSRRIQRMSGHCLCIISTPLTMPAITTTTVTFLTFSSLVDQPFGSYPLILKFKSTTSCISSIQHYYAAIPSSCGNHLDCNGADDCYDEHGNKGMCAAGAILNYTSQLTKYHPQGQTSRPLLRNAHEPECNCLSHDLTSAFPSHDIWVAQEGEQFFRIIS